MGAFGGMLILAGVAFMLVGHHHMGEGPEKDARGNEVYPIELFVVGLLMIAAGLIIGIYALVKNVDGDVPRYRDYFPESTKSSQ